MRSAALEIFSAALKEVDAGRAVHNCVCMDGSGLKVFDAAYNLKGRETTLYAIAIGKAALSMAASLDEILGHRLTEGIVAAPSVIETEADALLQQLISVGQVSKEEAETQMFRKVARRAVEHDAGPHSHHPSPLSSRWKVFHAGHPMPNQASLDAARSGIKLLQRAESERALILFLISGGGSACFEWPVDERITLEDLREANRALVSCGATIAEVNAVRRAISAVKGGRLSAFAPNAQQVSLIVSDTNPGEESTVASGPTCAPPEDAPDARDVISRYQLEKRLPSSVLNVIKESSIPASKKSGLTDARHFLLLDNRSAIEAASRAAHTRGFVVNIASDVIEQPVEEGCARLISRLLAAKAENSKEPFCLISGGEFVCPVRGNGTGGRNQETVLRSALVLDERRHQGDAVFNRSHTVILSAGTDGIDGNSPAAGAVCDELTIERARALKMNARRSLEQSDAYTFFQALDDALITGQTGTNVRDLRIMLAR